MSYEREALLKRALGAAGQRQQQQVPGADHVSVADLRRGFPVAAARLREAAAVTAREGSTALDAVVSEMAMGLVGKDDAVLPARECPETLLLDLDALRRAQNELQRLCVSSAAYLSIAHFPERRHVLEGGSDPNGSPPRKDAVARALHGALGTQEISVSSVGIAVAAILRSAGSAPAADTAEVVAGALTGVAHKDNPVLSLSTKHIRRALFLLLVNKLRSKQGRRFSHAVDREFEALQRKVRDTPGSMQRGAILHVNPEAMAPLGETGINDAWASPHAWKEALIKAGLRDVPSIHAAVDTFAESLSDVLALNLSVCEGIYTRLLSDSM